MVRRSLATRDPHRAVSRGPVGLFNGLLVELAQIDSFIATLGTGTVLYAIAMWHSQGHQIMGRPARWLHRRQQCAALGSADHRLLCPRIVVRLSFILEYLPIGRYLYAIGANPKAAALNGIPVRRYTVLAFVASGVLTARAGVMLASKLRVGQASVGLEFCCRLWSVSSSARRRSNPVASTCGER